MLFFLLACAAPHRPLPTPVAASVAPDAQELVRRMRSAIGDPYGADGLHFVFAVGDTRREIDWDIPHDRIAVRYTRPDGVTCTVTTRIGYDGPDAEQRTAWESFVNDQFWLLAPWKVGDAGATVTRGEGGGVEVRYAGVGVTPGDAYRFDVDEAGVVRGWTFTLASGRTGEWTWAPPTTIGPLRLSLERTSATRTIRFEEVRVEPILLGEPNVDCPLKTPLAR